MIQLFSDSHLDSLVVIIILFIFFFITIIDHVGSSPASENVAAGLEVEGHRHPRLQPVHPAAARCQHHGETSSLASLLTSLLTRSLTTLLTDHRPVY